jgi:GNAT superfamily N-acetyltransferase
MKAEYVPFTETMVPAAGNLLADRHARNRRTLPLLPKRFESSQVATKAIDVLWQKKMKSGYAAYRNGRMIAYFIGETTTQPWGRSGYVYLPGCAFADGENPSILQDLYALLGEEWVRKGIFNHYLYISAADTNILDSFFDLGFGKERVDALMDLGALEIPDIQEPKAFSIRKAAMGDNSHLGSLSNVIFRALAKAPYWHPTVPEDWDDLQEGWSDLADDQAWTVWLALENNIALGTVGFTLQNEADTDLLASPRTIYLSVAATKPHARGRGISTLLTWYGLEEARKNGFEICYTNWISPNLLASRFWPHFGFKDVAYRIARKVSPMISWAKDE